MVDPYIWTEFVVDICHKLIVYDSVIIYCGTTFVAKIAELNFNGTCIVDGVMILHVKSRARGVILQKASVVYGSKIIEQSRIYHQNSSASTTRATIRIVGAAACTSTAAATKQ